MRDLRTWGSVGVLLLLAAFGPAGGQEKKTTKSIDYYPIEPGNAWDFRVSANGKNVVISTKIEKVEKIDGQSLSLLTCSTAPITEHLTKTADGIFRARLNDAIVSPPFCLLKAPMKVGTKWGNEFTAGTDPGRHRYTAEIQAEETVEVPAGKFKTLRVYFDLQDANGQQVKTTYWFAPNVGFVRQQMELPNATILLEMQKFERAK